jgi:hypothetical protein
MFRAALLSFALATVASMAVACSAAPVKTGHDDPLPTEDDHSLPPDRSPGYDAGQTTTTTTSLDDAPLPATDAAAHVDAGGDAGEAPPPPPDAAPPSAPAGSVCQWVRLYGACPPPPGDGNECVPAVYGYAHWELLCHAL